MRLLQNWNKPPLLPHRSILEVLCMVWAIIVVWMAICGSSVLVAALVPTVALACIYLTARLMP